MFSLYIKNYIMFTIRDIFENRKKFFNVLKESYFNKK